MLVSCLLGASLSWAGDTSNQSSVYNYNAKSTQSIYRTPEDVIPRVPILNLIPRQFLLNHYTVDLRWDDIRLDHHGTTRTQGRPQRYSVSMSYAYPMGDEGMYSRLELPLWSSARLQSGWTRSSMSNYAVHFLHTPGEFEGLKLLANAKFE